MVTHPVADLFPMLPADELQALADDIKANGLHHPIIMDRAGVLLDGRNRLAACKLADVTPRLETFHGDDPVTFIVSVNVNRRHLNAGQKAMLAMALLPFYETQAAGRRGHGLTSPGRTLGADLPQASKPKRAPRARDRAAKAAGASGRSVAQAKRLTEQAPELADKVTAGELALDAAEKEMRQRKATERATERQAAWDAAVSTSPITVDVRHGDFREALTDIEPGSLDAIVTDPPYPDEFLPLWSDLAAVAAKLLRPGAPLIAYSGQYRLPEVLARITEHLTYQWTVILDMPGENSRFHATHMIQTWKPIIIATAGPWGPHEWAKDRVISPAKDQNLYEWQQNPDPVAELIARYVPVNGLVLDPFTGVGSFGLATLNAGRRFIGVEIDAGRHSEARGRITEASECAS